MKKSLGKVAFSRKAEKEWKPCNYKYFSDDKAYTGRVKIYDNHVMIEKDKDDTTSYMPGQLMKGGKSGKFVFYVQHKWAKEAKEGWWSEA